MLGKSIKIQIFSFLFLLAMVILPMPALSQTVDEGISLYKAGKYAEAIESLTKAREADPKSSTAAFFLGMAYKQSMDYESAQGHLRDAVTLTPRIKEALIELIDVSLQLGQLSEANKWIGVAEQENILPAKTAFLKGLVLTEEGKNKEAAAAFEKAKSLDGSIAQASDIQIALTHMRDSELKEARNKFQSAITSDPQTDMAGFARQYLTRVEETISSQRPWHVTVSMFDQYDDNMVLKPTDQSLATGVTNQSSFVMNSSVKVTYSPKLTGQWLFSGYYNFSPSLHMQHKDTHDSISNTISVTPGYNFGKYAINLSATYSHSLVRNPDYEGYSGNLSAGPMIRISPAGNQLLEFYTGYNNNDYLQDALVEEENRDAWGVTSYGSWVWLFKKNSFLNLRYQVSTMDADGRNWDNTSHSVSANVVIPASENVKIQFSGQGTKQSFINVHTVFDVKREDKIYNLSGGVSWDCFKSASLIGQYSYNRNKSNIGIYDYTRNLYTLGFEYKF